MSLKTKYYYQPDITEDGYKTRVIEAVSKENLYLSLFKRANNNFHYTLVKKYASMIALFPYENVIAFQNFTLFAHRYVWQQICTLIFVLYQYGEIEMIMKIMCKILHRWKCIQPYFSMINPIDYIESKPKLGKRKRKNKKRVMSLLKNQLPPDLIRIVVQYYSLSHNKAKLIKVDNLVFDGLDGDSPQDSAFTICTVFSSLYFDELKKMLIKKDIGNKVLQVVTDNFGKFIFSSMGYYMFKALDYAYHFENLTETHFDNFANNIVDYLKKHDDVSSVYQYPLLPAQQRFLVDILKTKCKDSSASMAHIFSAWFDDNY